MLNADGQAHQVFGDAGGLQFVRRQLPVGGARRVARQRTRVADVDQPQNQLQCVNEARARLLAAANAETQNAGGPAAEAALDQRVVGVVFQPGVVDPGHLRVRLQEARHRQRVVGMAFNSQRQTLDALQHQETVERRQRRTHVAKRHDARAPDVGGLAQRLGIDDAVVGGVGFVQHRVAGGVFAPREAPGVNDDAADAAAVAAHVFGQRMHDDVGAVLKGAAQARRRHGVVHNQRHAAPVAGVGHRLQVGDVARRVAERLAEHGLGVFVHVRGDVIVLGETHADAEARQGVGEQVVGAAVEAAGGDDVVAVLGDGEHRVGDGRHARRQRQRADAALHFGDALFQHRGCRVHDARVDVALDLEVEQVGAVLRVLEGVGGGLVDGRDRRARGRLGLVAAVDCYGLYFHVFFTVVGVFGRFPHYTARAAESP